MWNSHFASYIKLCSWRLNQQDHLGQANMWASDCFQNKDVSTSYWTDNFTYFQLSKLDSQSLFSPFMSQAEVDTQKQLILTTNPKLFISVFYNAFQVLNSSNTKMSSSGTSLKYKYEVWLALSSWHWITWCTNSFSGRNAFKCGFPSYEWYIFIAVHSEGMLWFCMPPDWHMGTLFWFFSWIFGDLELLLPQCQMALQTFLKKK